MQSILFPPATTFCLGAQKFTGSYPIFNFFQLLARFTAVRYAGSTDTAVCRQSPASVATSTVQLLPSLQSGEMYLQVPPMQVSVVHAILSLQVMLAHGLVQVF